MTELLSVARRWKRLLPQAKSIPKRVPLTIAVFAVILVIGLIGLALGGDYWSTFVQRFGWDLSTLQRGHIYAAWLGLFFSAGPYDFFGILVLIVLTLGTLEYRRGTAVASAGFLVIGPLASIVTLLILWPISISGVQYVHRALFTPDVGSSTACLACLGIFLSGERGLWRNIALFSILALLLGLLFMNSVYNFDHFGGYVIGLGAGTAYDLPRRRRTPLTMENKRRRDLNSTLK